MPNDDRPGRGRIGRKGLQAARSAHSVARQRADFLGDLSLRGRGSVVILSLEPHDARFLGGTKADGKHRSESDRELSEYVAGAPLADGAFDPVGEPDSFDATLEHCKQRPLVPLVHRVLTRHKADVSHHAGQSLTAVRVQGRKDRDRADFLRRYHRPGATSVEPAA